VNPSLQKIFHAEIRLAGFEFLEDMLDDSRRLERLALIAAHNLKGQRLGVRRGLWRQKPILPHQGQRLVSPAQDDPRVLGARRVVARRLGNTRQQRRFVGVIRGQGREPPAKVVFRGPREPVLTVAHVHHARVPGENFFLRSALRPEPLPHLLFEPQREPHLFPLAR
jgi:hypothetical protein